jgi:N-acyl-D-aspartate/D-glutamate deacylase
MATPNADLVIRGGTVVDGTGRPAFEADVAITDGRIAAVGPDLPARGGEEIAAKGMLVTPGFVDIHTHYDGQAVWDSHLTPSESGSEKVSHGGGRLVRPRRCQSVPR